MNKRMRFCAVVMAVCLLLALWALPAAAANYTYTVTLYAGNHATFTNGSDTLTYTGLKAGQMVSFSTVLEKGVVLDNDTKYYVRGVRLSGRDNNTVSSTAFRVEGDAMYVLAFGIRGEMVAYTVNYVDEAGNALLESQTFYGNVGDKPVVAFQYVEGYLPQAYNLTRTLSDNAAENVFDFVYAPVEGPAAPTPAPTEAPAEGQPEGTEGGENEGGETTPDQPPIDLPDQPTPIGPGGGENGEDTGPSQLIDLDENETPLAEGIGGFFNDLVGEDGRLLSTPGIVTGVSIGSAALLGALILIPIWKRRRREDD